MGPGVGEGRRDAESRVDGPGGARRADADREEEAHGPGGVEDLGVEEAEAVLPVVDGLVVGDPQAEVQGEPRHDLPGVLDVPREVLVEVVARDLLLGLGVGVEEAEERVREGVPRVLKRTLGMTPSGSTFGKRRGESTPSLARVTSSTFTGPMKTPPRPAP